MAIEIQTHTVLPSVTSYARETIKVLWEYLIVQGETDYLGEEVSQLEHSLQSAHLAEQSGADEDTILAALLHDVGRFIPLDHSKMPPSIAPNGDIVGRGSHEVFGEGYLRSLGFSDKICQLVGSHVWAKRYLTAVTPAYYDSLSKTSKVTLRHQGGPFNSTQVKAAQQDPLLPEKLALRQWDDRAKMKGLSVPGLEAYTEIAVGSLTSSRKFFTLHERVYHLPQRPTVAVCVDGFDPEYLHDGIERGILPNLAKFCKAGTSVIAHAAMPTFTNPNNCSIITGAPTKVHGISGNYYLDQETGEERLVLDDATLRGSTILEQLSKRGVRVAAITAKDKLRRIIQHGLDPARGDICFSAQEADQCTMEENGVENLKSYVGRGSPPQYSGDLSLYVLDAGIRLLADNKADVFYLTLSDFIQHKHAPGAADSDQFLSALDDKLGQLDRLGAIVGITGDHGMSDKCLSDGSPNVLYVGDLLDERFGQDSARVICPITDPFVKHHGALGSFVRVHVSPARSCLVWRLLRNGKCRLT